MSILTVFAVAALSGCGSAREADSELCQDLASEIAKPWGSREKIGKLEEALGRTAESVARTGCSSSSIDRFFGETEREKFNARAHQPRGTGAGFRNFEPGNGFNKEGEVRSERGRFGAPMLRPGQP